MTLAAEFGSGQVLWSVVWLSLFVLWVWFVLTLFGDIIHSDDLSGGGKAVWALGILVLPLLGAILYLIVNGDGMNRRMIDDSDTNPAIRGAMIAGNTVDGLGRLAEAYADGEITDAEFTQAKAQLLAT